MNETIMFDTSLLKFAEALRALDSDVGLILFFFAVLTEVFSTHQKGRLSSLLN